MDFWIEDQRIVRKIENKELESSHPETETFKFYPFFSFIDTRLSYFLGTLDAISAFIFNKKALKASFIPIVRLADF